MRVEREAESREDVEMEDGEGSEREVVEGDSSSSESQVRSSVPIDAGGEVDPDMDAEITEEDVPPSPPISAIANKRTLRSVPPHLHSPHTNPLNHSALPTPASLDHPSSSSEPETDPTRDSSPIRAELVERSQQRSQEATRSQEELRVRREVARNEEVVRGEEVRVRREKGRGRRIGVLGFGEWLKVRGNGEEGLFDEELMGRLRAARQRRVWLE